MIGVWSSVLDALDRYGRAAMVTLAAIRGSSPREAGARLIIRPDGTFTGTIGGGTLEWKAIAIAQASLANPNAAKAEARGFSLGPELGQCCGGNVELIVEVIEADKRGEVAEFARLEAAGSLTTEGRLSAEHGVERVRSDEAMVPGSAAFSAGMLREGFGDDRRPLLVFGAGHVGRALVLALAPLPFRVTWLDPRPDAFPAHVPMNATLRVLGAPEEAIAEASPESFVLVMTHSHPLDLAILGAVFAQGDFPYVGLIGSKSKRARFSRQLATAGIPAARIAALVCPIGVDGIHAKAPAVIAAATVAEMLVRDEALRAAAHPEIVRHPRARGG
jgi:xanthine dehydrogenase accessory factor